MDATALLPEPPRTQALASKTFSPPPLDGSLTLPELYEWHLKNSPNHRLFIFSRQDGGVRSILWSETVSAIHTGTRLVRKIMGWKPGMKEVPIVAVVAASDSISYFTMLMAILRAGYTAFPISARNSPKAVAHLISKVKVRTLFIGREQAMVDLTKDALKILKVTDPDISHLDLHPIPLFEDLFLDSSEDPDDIPWEKRGLEEIVMYLHSSGSTAFPKPIARTNRRLIEIALNPYFGERDLCDVIFSLHAVPMYHGMGVAQLCWTASCGLVNGVFEPKSPAQLPTPSGHFEAAVAVNSDFVFCVPAVIEAWSRKPDYLEWLATRGGVIYGGGPLNKEVGDYLVSQGVSIFNTYASTEAGVANPMVPAAIGGDWEYFRFAENINAEMVPYGDGIYELVIIVNPFCRPSVINTRIDGADAYATSDLFTEHPQKRGFWRVYGRTDDQIMHSTGEKTNPGPLETILNQDPHVQSAVIFGRGQFQAGVILDPSPQFKFDPNDEHKLAEFRNMIWPTVQRMNTFAPQHSRLFKEMIIVSGPSKPFQYTVKNSARRQAVINDYSDEIKALYETVAESTQSSIPPPREWDLASTIDFVRLVVNNVLKNNVSDDEDIFQRGCDSLQATWIRNTLLRAAHDSADIDTRNLVDNFVYEHSTILSMGSFLYALATGTSPDSPISDASHVAAMRSMVKKYTSTGFSIYEGVPSPNGSAKPLGDIVLVTGTTGALGSYLLAELVENPAFSKIYALNRRSLSARQTLRERQEKALLERGLNASSILGSDKVRLVEGDLAVARFGLAENLYKEMQYSVSYIIHNAWPVDFNLALSSFERSIKGVRNMVDFALGSLRFPPPTLVYTSSVGVFQKAESVSLPTLPEGPISPEVAVKSGYTESKWVSEEILYQASKCTPLKSIVVRVGQLCGGLNGSWNTSEWFPALVQSSQALGSFPTDQRIVHWIPLHTAAKSLIDLGLSGGTESSTTVHLIHPRPTSWSFISKIIAEDLHLDLIPFDTWLRKLKEVGENNSSNGIIKVEVLRQISALRLLSFFESMSRSVKDKPSGVGFERLDCEAGIRMSRTLANPDISQLGEGDIRAWLRYWQSVDFITG